MRSLPSEQEEARTAAELLSRLDKYEPLAEKAMAATSHLRRVYAGRYRRLVGVPPERSVMLRIGLECLRLGTRIGLVEVLRIAASGDGPAVEPPRRRRDPRMRSWLARAHADVVASLAPLEARWRGAVGRHRDILAGHYEMLAGVGPEHHAPFLAALRQAGSDGSNDHDELIASWGQRAPHSSGSSPAS